MDFNVNLNDKVKVKLTNYGVSILKEQHDDLNSFIKGTGGKGLGDFQLSLNEDGYYETQLWMLMSKFGHVMEMTNESPFELNVIIENGKPIN